MKRLFLHRVGLAVLLMLCFFAPLKAMDDFEWEQHGYIRYSLGYSWFNGDSTLDYDDYSISLSGNLYQSENDLEYTFAKEPGISADVQLFWDNPFLSARYDKGIKLDFDELNLAFNKNQVDGMKITSSNDGVTLFRGEESYIPMSKFFFVTNPARNEFTLLDIPSAGDIVEHSEAVIMDGEVLTGGRDYTLNYLSGKLQMYVPLEWGSTIDVKFLFIATSDELAPEGELLQGIFLAHRWLDNNLGLFYFKRGDNVNQVLGVNGQYSVGPLKVRGEYALSKADEAEPVQAYEVESHYNDGILDVSYQLRNIDPEFQEIGVVPFIKGKSNSFGLKYQADPNLLFQLQLSKYEYDDGWMAFTTNQKKTTVEYTMSSSQSAQLIFEEKDRDLYGERLVNNDFSIGYSVKTKPVMITLGQSLQDVDKRFAKIWVDYGPFRIGSSYSVESLWDGKEQQAKAEISFRPFSKLDLMSFTEYRKRFDAEKPNLRIHLNGNWSPSDAWSINGGYLFFNNPKYEANSQRLNSIINYATSRMNSNINVTKMKNVSKTAEVDDLDVVWSTNMIFFKDYQLSYQLTTNDFREYNKYSEMINFEQKDRIHNFGLSYVWRDFFVFSTNLGYISNLSGGQGFSSEATTRSQMFGCSYQKDLKHQFSVDVGTEKKNDQTTLSFDSRLIHPMGPVKLDYKGKINYNLDDKVLTKSLFTYSVVFPDLWKITPSVTFQSDFANEGQSQRVRKLGGKLEYQWREQQMIFFEGKGEELTNWLNHKEDYTSFGLFTGVQIDY